MTAVVILAYVCGGFGLIFSILFICLAICLWHKESVDTPKHLAMSRKYQQERKRMV
jgi:hypothetical protein